MIRDNKPKPSTGRLIWKKTTGEVIVIKEGPWGLLNSIKEQLKLDPTYSGGKLKLTY